jgi:hypothetical protein
LIPIVGAALSAAALSATLSTACHGITDGATAAAAAAATFSTLLATSIAAVITTATFVAFGARGLFWGEVDFTDDGKAFQLGRFPRVDFYFDDALAFLLFPFAAFGLARPLTRCIGCIGCWL